MNENADNHATVNDETPFRTLDDIIKEYKPYELDFITPNPDGDVRSYIDLYLMYESKDPQWHEVQALIFDYFNRLIERYRSKKIKDDEVLELLHFPEVEYLGLGHCVEGIKGRGSHEERATLIKEAILDDKDIKEFGIKSLAKASIEIEGIGPDLLSDMVGNFALENLIKYTSDQVKTYSLKTLKINLNHSYDNSSKEWKSLVNVDLPFFKETGEPRILVPRHIARRMPLLSTSEFYNGFLKYVVQDEELSRKRIVRTIGKEPKVTIKEVEKVLEKEYGELNSSVIRKIAKERPELVAGYSSNPHKFDTKRRPRKPKIDWESYIKEVKEMPKGRKFAKDYILLLRKIFTVMYGNNLLNGKLETHSTDDIYRYDISYLNASTTDFFKVLNNQQIIAGVIILEGKNYGSSEVANKEFNQGISYTIKDGREFIFLINRDEITAEDIKRSKSIYLRQRVIIMPLSDEDIIKLIEMRHLSEINFDHFLNERLQNILSA